MPGYRVNCYRDINNTIEIAGDRRGKQVSEILVTHLWSGMRLNPCQ